MKHKTTEIFILCVFGMVVCGSAYAGDKAKIAVFSGATATVTNSVPLVSSNKARSRHGLASLSHPDGSPLRFDHLAPQRLAAPVEVLIEQFSAHPLERDVAQLYGPPDGYVDAHGTFHASRQSLADKPVYRATLSSEDGLYLLPYMAMQRDGSPWEGLCASAHAPAEQCRQSFYPDASRLFEEIDRDIGGRSARGTANLLHSLADFDFYRALPSAGYTQGLDEQHRTDVGRGAVAREVLGEDYFPYGRFRADPRLEDLARVSNVVQTVLDGDDYAGAIWLESSYTVAETAYWCGFNRSMQHLISNYREGDVENEAASEDLLH